MAAFAVSADGGRGSDLHAVNGKSAMTVATMALAAARAGHETNGGLGEVGARRDEANEILGEVGATDDLTGQ